MKTKKESTDVSKKRQELSRQCSAWKQKILELEVGVRAGIPGAAEKLSFCQGELDKIRAALNKTWTRQRAWASHGFISK
jgi:hypothetical protein